MSKRKKEKNDTDVNRTENHFLKYQIVAEINLKMSSGKYTRHQRYLNESTSSLEEEDVYNKMHIKRPNKGKSGTLTTLTFVGEIYIFVYKDCNTRDTKASTEF